MLKQVVPLVDSLYRSFFPNITFCSITGNKTMVELVRGQGYDIVTYELPNYTLANIHKKNIRNGMLN